MSLFLTLAACLRRDWRIALSYRTAYAIDLGSIVLTLVLFYYLARIVDSSSLPSSAHLNQDYFAFVAVGLAMARVLHAGLTAFATKLREEQTTGTLETVMASPTSPSVLILGSGAYELVRAMAFAVVMILAAAAFFGMHLDLGLSSMLVTVGGLLGCMFLFATLGVVLAAFTVVFKQVTAMIALATTGIALLGGVYFPLGVLPQGLQFLANLLPFTWGLEVLRASLLNGESETGKLGLLIAFDLVALPCALLLFNYALRYARRQGSLAQY
jgi:ABC-2 type transport system permease protein